MMDNISFIPGLELAGGFFVETVEPILDVHFPELPYSASRRTGFYLSVIKEGTVNAGDEITELHRSTHGVTVSDITRLYVFDREDIELMNKVLEVEALPESWREYFAEQLRKLRK